MHIPTVHFPELSIGQYRFYLEGDKSVLPRYAGSTWRGVFGHALKRTVCVTQSKTCASCPLKHSCAYSYIFESPPPENSEKMRKYSTVPHPYILQLLNNEPHDSNLCIVGMNLFGKANQYFPFLVYAWQKAASRGVTRRRESFQLVHVEQYCQEDESWRQVYGSDSSIQRFEIIKTHIPQMPEKMEIHFFSPLRIKYENQYMNESRFDISAFVMNLIRRISMIMYFHNDTVFDADFKELKHISKNINLLEKNLEWQDWTRFSNRQKTSMKMGGLVGKIKLSLINCESLWPFLWLGQYVHAGKVTSMGLGQYRINTL